MNATIEDRATEVIHLCRDLGLTIATVESCTGGLVAGTLTGVPGSSSVIDRGFVTYTNKSKSELVGVAAELFARVGAVSEEVARAMAAGALAHSIADIAVATTGVAGPGQSENKPAGLVHVCATRRNGSAIHEQCHFSGNRREVREASVLKAFDLIEALT